MLQTTGFHICKQKTIDNCTWNLSLKFIEVRIFCYLMPVIGKNLISWFYAYVEHIEIKTKTVRGVASLFCSASNQTWKGRSGGEIFFFTRCKMVRSEVFSWVNLIHKQHIDFMILLDRIYLKLPKICSSCLSRHELLHNFV